MKIQNDYKFLWNYINKNINTYLENIFFKLEHNIEESEEAIIKLLNRKEVSNEIKEKIISKENNKIEDISCIEEKELWKILLKENKVNDNWENINHYSKVYGIDESLEAFIVKKESWDISKKGILELLNNQDIEVNIKEQIIQKEKFELQMLSSIEEKQVWKSLVDESKINNNWDNIIHYSKVYGIDESLAAFIENKKAENISAGTVLEFLNRENIEVNIKEQVIQKEKFELQDISSVEEKQIWKNLVDESKINNNWENINHYSKEYGINESLVAFREDKKIESISEKEIIKLLNSEDIELNVKEQVIQKEKFVLLGISWAEDKELWRVLLEESKVFESWDNINEYSKEYGIDEQLKAFIENKKVENISEKEILELLNREDIENDVKIQMIQKEKFELQDISHIEDTQLWKILLEDRKVNNNWDNINHYSKEYEIDDSLEAFIKDKKAKNVSEKEILELLNSEDLEGDVKVQIIEKENFELQEISSIEKKELWKSLVGKSKINNNWDNINHYSKTYGIDESLETFIEEKKAEKMSEKEILELLNRKDIEFDLKEKVIEKENFTLQNFYALENENLEEILIREDKVLDSWLKTT